MSDAVVQLNDPSARPLVSVVTPSYNQAEFLKETLESVYQQNYRPIEQIVIDGGSTDRTVELLRRWAADHAEPGYQFIWISEPDHGHGDAMNKGFARVSGAIVGWLNSDDVYFDRDVVGISVSTLQRNPDTDVVFGEVALISENSGLQMIWCFPRFDYQRILRNYLIPQPTVFFRRCVTDKHRFDPGVRVATDHVYWLMIGREHKFRKIGRVQAGDRDHAARQTHVNNALWKTIGREASAAFGAPEKVRVVARYHDLLWKVIMRFNGVRHAALILLRGPRAEEIAFPCWIDSPVQLIKRQLTMRVTNRTKLEPRVQTRDADLQT